MQTSGAAGGGRLSWGEGGAGGHLNEPEETGTMTKKALCIGINDYPGTDSDLQGCVNDATDWGWN